MPLFGDRRLGRRSEPRLTGESGKNNDLPDSANERGAFALPARGDRLLGAGSGPPSLAANAHEHPECEGHTDTLIFICQLLWSAEAWAPYQADHEAGPGFHYSRVAPP